MLFESEHFEGRLLCVEVHDSKIYTYEESYRSFNKR